jgi:hypothetical protein
VAREDQVDDTRDNRQDERSDQPKAARPLTRLAIIALAEDVIIHRRTPKSMLIGMHHDTSRRWGPPGTVIRGTPALALARQPFQAGSHPRP